MTLAKQLALQKMTVHGLLDRGWVFRFSGTKRAFGDCNYTRKVIRLSKHLVEANDQDRVMDTILHEIAHALEFINYGTTGHGYKWRNICIQIGGSGKARYSHEDTEIVKGNYALVHSETNEVFRYYYKMPRVFNKRSGYIRGRKQETLGKLVIRKVA